MTDKFYTILAWFIAIPNTALLMLFALQILACIIHPVWNILWMDI